MLRWLDPARGSKAKGYLIAVLSAGLALAATSLLQNYLQTRSLLFVLAVMFSALFCGLGPGLLSSVVSVLLITFLPPFNSFKVESVSDAIEVAIFGVVALSVNALNLARRRAEDARRQLLQQRLDAVEAEAKMLRGLLPICAWCKRIQDQDRWLDIETYARRHLATEFTHGICPDCQSGINVKMDR